MIETDDDTPHTNLFNVFQSDELIGYGDEENDYGQGGGGGGGGWLAEGEREGDRTTFLGRWILRWAALLL